MSKYKNIAVILSGGTGNRFGYKLPKQFFEFSGKSILEHTLTTFNLHPSIDEIIIVSKSDYIDKVERILSSSDMSKVTHIASGGKERSDSTISALSYIKTINNDHQNTKILIHDSVRPFISHERISQCLDQLNAYDAVNLVAPCTDTIISAEDGFVSDVLKRETLYQCQTPQGFKLSTLITAYDYLSLDSEFTATDDCSVIKHFLPSVPIKIVIGDHSNIKITNPNDIYIAEAILKLAMKT